MYVFFSYAPADINSSSQDASSCKNWAIIGGWFIISPAEERPPGTDEVLFDGKSDVSVKDDVCAQEFPLFPWQCLCVVFPWTAHAARFIFSCGSVCAWDVSEQRSNASGLNCCESCRKEKLALQEVKTFLLTGLLVHKINFITLLSPSESTLQSPFERRIVWKHQTFKQFASALKGLRGKFDCTVIWWMSPHKRK